jgi:CDP-6-deoxy-D-xylo-4-hexulose-3-dehydrase
MWWPLMNSAITSEDKLKLINFIASTDKYTNGQKVKEFEQKWSEWLGCRHSLFVSSGSAANFLLLASVKELYEIPDKSKVLVPACTWVTNVAPVFQLGLEPVFVDIDFDTFSFDTQRLPDEDIKIIFITHLLGLNAPVEALKGKYPNAIILEDICESHGLTDVHGNKRGCGTGSTFSFYYGHHMTTIEGGMVCTDNDELYELMLLKRSHGMARNLPSEKYQQAIQKYPDIDPAFMFLTDGYNFRSTELNAILGIEQLNRLDENIKIRRDNYKYFLENIDKDKFHVPTYDDGNSSFCFPFICNSKNDKLKLIKILDDMGVESRPVVAGNLLIHPFLKKWKDTVHVPNAETLNECGVYIGNNQFVNTTMIQKVLDTIKDLW